MSVSAIEDVEFELAYGGTLFFDEIGSRRLDLQANLLCARQQREVERVGSLRPMARRRAWSPRRTSTSGRCASATSARASSTV